jgi:hypothetical protein
VQPPGGIVAQVRGDGCGAARAAVGPHRADQAVLDVVGVDVVVVVAAAVGDVRRIGQVAVGVVAIGRAAVGGVLVEPVDRVPAGQRRRAGPGVGIVIAGFVAELAGRVVVERPADADPGLRAGERAGREAARGAEPIRKMDGSKSESRLRD